MIDNCSSSKIITNQINYYLLAIGIIYYFFVYLGTTQYLYKTIIYYRSIILYCSDIALIAGLFFYIMHNIIKKYKYFVF